MGARVEALLLLLMSLLLLLLLLWLSAELQAQRLALQWCPRRRQARRRNLGQQWALAVLELELPRLLELLPHLLLLLLLPPPVA